MEHALEGRGTKRRGQGLSKDRGAVGKSHTLEVTEYLSAALLKASGVRFLGTKPGDGARVVLLFENPDGQAAALLDQHLNGGAQVNSADFAAAIRTIKDAIFGARRG